MLIKEACVESYQDAIDAVRKGAHRIEFSSALMLGGVSPSLGLASYAQERLGVPLSIMVRPRLGSFEYSEADKQIMLLDIRSFCRLGVDSIITGALVKGELDTDFLSRVREEVHCNLVCHMCFDETSDLEQSLATLIRLGFDRVLTRGGKGSAEDNEAALAGLIELSEKAITIVVGGRVTHANYKKIVDNTGAREVHGRSLFA